MFAHKHYFGFTLPLESLKIHLKVDHGLTFAQIDELEDVEAWHTAQHPEITTVKITPDIEALAAQFSEIQGAVDQLVLNDLLDL